MTHAPFLPSLLPTTTPRFKQLDYVFQDASPPNSPLSPLPNGFPDIGELDGVSQSRQGTRQSLPRGEFKDVREAAFFNQTWITDRYCNVGDGVDSLERYLRDIWYMSYQPSLYTSRETLDHDRLRGR
jgi:hypothetical protein